MSPEPHMLHRDSASHITTATHLPPPHTPSPPPPTTQVTDCGITTSTAPINSVFQLSFTASNNYGLSATATRTIKVNNPCAANVGWGRGSGRGLAVNPCVNI